MNISIIILLFSVSFAQNLLEGTWVLLSEDDTVMSGRYEFAFCFNPATISLVLFGGYNEVNALDNTTFSFDLDSDTWSISSPLTSPSARAGSASARNSLNNNLIMFGGYTIDSLFTAELWTFNPYLEAWTILDNGTSGDGPSERAHSTHGFNSNSNEFLIFGGENGQTSFSDFWAYNFDSNTWTNLNSVGPSARSSSSSAFDNTEENFYVFGGIDFQSNVLGDFWKYSLSTGSWMEISVSTGPEPRYGHSLLYHPWFQGLYLFGGFTGSIYLDELWFYSISNGTWTSFDASVVLPRYYHGMDYDPVNGTIFIVAGEDTTAMYFVWAYYLSMPPSFSENQSPTVELISSSTLVAKTLTSRIVVSLGSTVSSQSVQSIITTSMINNQDNLINESSYNTSLPTKSSTVPIFSDIIMYSSTLNASVPIFTLKNTLESASNPKQDNIAELTNTPSIYILIGATGGVILVLLCILPAIYYRCCRTKKKFLSSAVSEQTLSSEWTNSTLRHGEDTTRTVSTVSNYTTSTKTETFLSTVFSTESGIYLPGFLKFSGSSDYKKLKQIAKGGSAHIYLANPVHPELRKRANLLAVKILHNQEGSKNEITIFHQEIAIMYYLRNCRNVTSFFGYSEHPFSIIMKYYQLGTLNNFLTTKKFKRSKSLMFFFMKDISEGTRAIHCADIAHCDLKPQNIMVDMDKFLLPYCVIGDFGVSRILSDEKLLVSQFKRVNLNAISYAYAAPEVMQRMNTAAIVAPSKHEILAGDIFSFGVLVFQLTTLSYYPWLKQKSS